MDRIKTGISGLDEALEGLLVGRTVLLTGDAGSGKTIFGLQFVHQCCKEGLRTTFLSTEETANDLRLQASSLGWHLKDFEEKGLLNFIEMVGPRLLELEAAMSINSESEKRNFEGLIDTLPDGVQVLIIDSLGSHTANLTQQEFKDRLDLFIYQLNKRNITTLLILDSATSKEYNDLALFSVHGALLLMKRENPYTGRRERVLDIVKMRNTRTPIQLLPFIIGSEGIMMTVDKDTR